MKKTIFLVAVFIFMMALSGCGADYNDAEIKITIPAGNTGEFVYSDLQISTNKNSITLSSDDAFLDAEIMLKGVEVKAENAYEPIAFTSGTAVDIEVEKNAWFKIGIAIPNDADENIIIYVNASDVIMRIE